MKKWILLTVGFGIVTLILVTVTQSFSKVMVTSPKSVNYQKETNGSALSTLSSAEKSWNMGKIRFPKLDFDKNNRKPIEASPKPYISSVAQNNALNVDDRLYKKSSQYDVVTKQVSQYMQQFKEFVLSIDGRVLVSNMQSQGNTTYGYMQVRVPVAKFEETNSRIVSEVDKVINEKAKTEDETGKIVNLQEQLTDIKNKLTEKQIELDQEKDPIKKSRLKAEIVKLEKQIKQLEKQMQETNTTVEYANVTVRVANSVKYFNPNVVEEKNNSLWEEAQSAWKSVFTILLVLARIIIWVVIYGIFWLPIVLIIRFIANIVQKPKDRDIPSS